MSTALSPACHGTVVVAKPEARTSTVPLLPATPLKMKVHRVA